MKTVLLIFHIFITSFLFAQKKNIRNLPVSKNDVIIIAHRGDHLVAPENSILSISKAIQDGADYVELDIRTTKDRKLVLMHDARIDRMTNGNGYVSELSFDTLKSFKLFNKNKTQADTTKIPSFDEALAACKDKINIYLDFKDADVQQVYAAIIAARMEHQIVVYINTLTQLENWRRWVPTMPLILSLNTPIANASEMVSYLMKTDIDILDGSWTEYNMETVQAAKNYGVPVWADMQSPFENDAYWLKGTKLALSGIQTDQPQTLVQFFKRQKINK